MQLRWRFWLNIWAGFPQSFPIFQTHLSTRGSAGFNDSVALALLAPGLQDIQEGILFQLLPKSADHRSKLVVIGITIIITSLVLASYATKAWQILLTQGILYGIGGILLNFVHVSIFSEWFDKKKGQAMGMIWLGYRVGGLAFPLICQSLLDKHGYPKTLRVMIAPMLALLLPSVVLFRGRYAAATVISKPAQPAISKIQALRTPRVLYYLIVALLFSFVTNVPMMFITKFGADLRLDPPDQALALSLVFASCMLGTYMIGQLSDKFFHQGLMAGSAISTSLVHVFLWGFTKSKYGLFVYAFCVGLTSGGKLSAALVFLHTMSSQDQGFHNCLFSFFSEVCGTNNELFTAIHSLFSFFEGTTILSVGPVGTALLKLSPEVSHGDYAIGKYKVSSWWWSSSQMLTPRQYLIAYASSMTMASGLLVLCPLCLGVIKSSFSRAQG